MQHSAKLEQNRTWLKTLLFLGAAGGASLIVAASFFTLLQQEFPLLRGLLSW
jgi:hypothetical protein